MAREDLRLPVEWVVIAIFADQHLGDECRSGEPAGDHPLWRWRLCNRAARTASIFGPADAQHPQARRHPVEHLTDALTDGVQLAPATGTAARLNVQQPLLALKMFGKHLSAHWLGAFERRWSAFDDLGDIAVEILKRERQLVGIDPLGAAAILRALELLDDLLEPFDLTVTMLDQARHVPHQLVQKSCVGRQIFKIEPHARYYSETI